MGDWNKNRIREHCVGRKLKDVEFGMDEIRLIFDNDIALIFTGGYAKEVYADLKRLVVSYEDV